MAKIKSLLLRLITFVMIFTLTIITGISKLEAKNLKDGRTLNLHNETYCKDMHEEKKTPGDQKKKEDKKPKICELLCRSYRFKFGSCINRDARNATKLNCQCRNRK